MYSQSSSNIHPGGLVDVMSIFPGVSNSYHTTWTYATAEPVYQLRNRSEPFSSKEDYLVSGPSSDATVFELGCYISTPSEWLNSHQAHSFDDQHQEPTSAHHVVSAVPPVQPDDDLSAGPQSLAVTSSLGVYVRNLTLLYHFHAC